LSLGFALTLPFQSLVEGVGINLPDVIVYLTFRPMLPQYSPTKIVVIAEDMLHVTPYLIGGIRETADPAEQIQVSHLFLLTVLP
jgi:hypothetical protein